MEGAGLGDGDGMDDRHNERSASSIFSVLIRQSGAQDGSETQDSGSGRDRQPQSAAEEAFPVGDEAAEAALMASKGAGEALPPSTPPAGAEETAGGFFGGAMRALLILPLVALLTAGLATFAISWQEHQTQQQERARPTADAQQAALMVTPRHLQRIGIVAGHRGVYDDPGAVCEDGLTEREVNEVVAEKVVLHLRGLGFHAELLDEFDSRLQNYQATALVSLHSNDCRDYGEFVSGYLIARAAARAEGGPDDLLAKCVGENYRRATGLRVRAGMTSDMSEYHSFVEIHPLTPAVILEMGFLLGDRRLLTEESDRVARGVYDGILCFLDQIGVT